MGTVRYTDDQITSALVETEGVIAQAAHILGCSSNALGSRISRNTILKATRNTLREEKRHGPIKQGLENRQIRQQIEAGDGTTDDEAYEAILRANGSVIEAAAILNVAAPLFQKRVARNPRLRDAIMEGQEYQKALMEDRYMKIASGELKVAASEAQAAFNYLKCQCGWTPTQKVEHKGLAFDIESVPDEDVEPDLPVN
jgi:hypothetical protein